MIQVPPEAESDFCCVDHQQRLHDTREGSYVNQTHIISSPARPL